MSPKLLRRATDEMLGGRLASGEAAAFDELYRRYAHRLAAYGAHLLGDRAAGEDVAQASLLKAYGALRAGRVPDTLRPWLYRIAHNAAIDIVARRRELPSAELPDRGREDAADRGALVEALGSLPDRQRRVYVLREIHGLRINETAAELGLTTPQVEQALFAARNRLAELLVFGERLSCVAVQRLVEGPLDGDERRGLKTHLRSCPACRRGIGRRAVGLVLLPLPSLDWLRGLAGLGSAPVAAKIGVAVATVTVATSVPLSLDRRSPLTHAPARSALAVSPAHASAPRQAVAPRAQLVASQTSSPVAPPRAAWTSHRVGAVRLVHADTGERTDTNGRDRAAANDGEHTRRTGSEGRDSAEGASAPIRTGDGGGDEAASVSRPTSGEPSPSDGGSHGSDGGSEREVSVRILSSGSGDDHSGRDAGSGSPSSDGSGSSSSDGSGSSSSSGGSGSPSSDGSGSESDPSSH